MTSTTTAPHASRGPELAAAELDAAAAEIDMMPMPDRSRFLRVLRETHGAELGAGGRWRNLEGVIEFFHASGLGQPGSWVSWVNAGVLEGVERGLALALDPGADDYGNPGARAWASYLRQLDAGELTQPHAHAQAWSVAKKVCTDYGVQLASDRGQVAAPAEQRFLLIAEGYNWAMANRAPVNLLVGFAGLLHPSLAGMDRAAVERLFDVGDTAAARRGCEIAYAAAKVDPSSWNVQHVVPLLPLLRQLFDTMR